MRVDFHVHLEEGPYSSQWLPQLTETLGSLLGDEKDGGRREWAYEMVGQLAKRLRQGPYSREWLDLYRAYRKWAKGTAGSKCSSQVVRNGF